MLLSKPRETEVVPAGHDGMKSSHNRKKDFNTRNNNHVTL
ncbi:hypothetical protein GDI1208 [Gluconacetobacter diazotrophicus PA1 5]|uniref:Uncharacterized protein n=1 Tax=Gluconacetobacter diazotrophicus (strain ATCC 49037 / DSM 5601 / CCUG 37298 / CIP 103539 / LMG 7603 / PAl5) TaxID=272568 RepID=A9HDV9_GLUDA|nr:hypothetical protein GDI1208 [Gluconacetobacter diazotrophicus PA1 5]